MSNGIWENRVRCDTTKATRMVFGMPDGMREEQDLWCVTHQMWVYAKWGSWLPNARHEHERGAR